MQPDNQTEERVTVALTRDEEKAQSSMIARGVEPAIAWWRALQPSDDGKLRTALIESTPR